MPAAVAGALGVDTAKQSRFRSVATPEVIRKQARSRDPQPAIAVLSEALLDVSRELQQLRQCAQQARAMDLEARHRRLHMYLADCATHRADQPGGPGA